MAPKPNELLTGELLDGVAQDLDVLVFLLDVEEDCRLRFAAASGEVLQLAGANGPVVGSFIEDVLPPATAGQLQLAAERALLSGQAERWACEDQWPLGKRVFHLSVTPLDGRRRLAGVAHDVTTQHELLLRTQRRDDRNRSILDGIPAEVALIDLEGRIDAVNANWVRRDAVSNGRSGPGDDFIGTEAGVVTDGVRAVLAGRVPRFEADVDEGDRWVNVLVAPVGERHPTGAVIIRFDISHRKEEVIEVNEMRHLWAESFEASPFPMAVCDENGRMVRINAKWSELLGRSRAELIGTSMLKLYLPEDVPAAIENGRRALAGEPVPALEFRHVRPDGSTVWALVTSTRVLQSGGRTLLYFQAEVITERKQSEGRLADHHRLVELVASGTPLGVVLAEIAETGERGLPGSRWLTHVRAEDGTAHVGDGGTLADGAAHALGNHLSRLIGSTDWQPGHEPAELATAAPEIARTARAHGHRTGWIAGIGASAVGPRGAVLVLDPPTGATDSDRRFVQQLASVARIALDRDDAAVRLARSALEDSLTGLANRSAWWHRLEQARARVRPGGSGFAVLVANLDHLRRVNEVLGYSAGDAAIVDAARRARATMRPQDVVARSGGDEILVLIEDLSGPEEAGAMADALLEAIRVVGGPQPITASVGFSVQLTPNLLSDPERDAALAMHLAKAKGGDRVEQFNDELRSAAVDRVQRENELRDAIDRRELVVHYQPEIDLRNGTVAGVEALVRWNHPTRGLLAPSEFIGTAEDSGLIVEIGLQVLDEACGQLAAWNAEGLRLTMAVNLSARQLAEPSLIQDIATLLDDHGVAGNQLLFEITESTLVEEPERAAAVLASLRDLGARLAIDDFGTGYSSLLYLKRFRLDALKIDRSFVDGLGTDPGDSAIVAAVLRLAHTLDLEVIAEGVETEGQLHHLRTLGCEYAQGFLWSQPVLPEQLAGILRRGVPELRDAPNVQEDSEMDDLLAVLTHELSTPLTVIGGYAEMLGRQVDEDPAQDDGDGIRSGLSAIERNVGNLSRLVDALVEARGLGATGVLQEIDLLAFVTTLVEDLAPLLAEHHPVVASDGGEALVLADALGVRQVLTNLIGNAVKFSPAGSVIRLDVSGAPGRCEVAVSDHGDGIPVEREHELFGRFSRLGSTRKGLGLGLHLSRLIARRLGGELRHRRVEGRGATFVLELPTIR